MKSNSITAATKAGLLSYPSPREAEARVGGCSCNPHTGSRLLADPPHNGEGEETPRLGGEA